MLWFESLFTSPDLHKGQCMERTVTGQSIQLQIIRHDDQVCQEFVVESTRFCYRRWMIWTVVLNAIGYMLQLHTQDPRTVTGLATVVFLILLLRLYYKVKQESLLVVSTLGVQITTRFALGHATAKFYDWDQIHDLVISEAVTMHKVIFYLTLLLRENPSSTAISRLVPLFTHTWPSLHCLQQIYSGAQQVMKHAVTTQHASS